MKQLPQFHTFLPHLLRLAVQIDETGFPAEEKCICRTALLDQTLEIDFDRTPYKTISKAAGGQNNFIDSAYDAILPEIKVLQGKLIAVQEYFPIFNLG
jgi:hypothetical protein